MWLWLSQLNGAAWRWKLPRYWPAPLSPSVLHIKGKINFPCEMGVTFFYIRFIAKKASRKPHLQRHIIQQLALKYPLFVTKKIWGASPRTRLATSTS